MRGSHTKNPIDQGPFACFMALPWLYGSAEKPEGACSHGCMFASVALLASICACRVSLLLESTRGEFCRICFNTLKVSGLLALYKTVGKFKAAANGKHELMAEFLAARLEFIAQVNSGNVPMRSRASKRGDPKVILKEAWR